MLLAGGLYHHRSNTLKPQLTQHLGSKPLFSVTYNFLRKVGFALIYHAPPGTRHNHFADEGEVLLTSIQSLSQFGVV